MLTLYQTRRAWNVPNLSPFCTKLETYLRMADIPYQIDPDENPFRKSPKGKVPFIRFEGRLIADSSVVIAFLKERLGDTLDGQLSVSERANGHMLQRMLEEGTYWCGIYLRWLDDQNFELVRQVYFERAMGRTLRMIVPDLVRRRVLSALHDQGTSRHDRSWVFATALRDMEAVSSMLGDKPYLFGERPSSYDAIAYAFASGFWRTPFGKDLPPPPGNLDAYIDRIQKRYFPELG